VTGLSALSEALPWMLPDQDSDYDSPSVFPYPRNMAVRPEPTGSSAHYIGGSESSGLQAYLWVAHPNRKPPQREGVTSRFLASTRSFWETRSRQDEKDISELKTKYVFRNERVIAQFVVSHRTIVPVLLNAMPQLKTYFGDDVVFSLEAVRDEDESTSLYAIAVWRGAAMEAEAALAGFDEHWWLYQPPQPRLTFTYELV
jgi:hypothetical protein